jgi:hypothetical protein
MHRSSANRSPVFLAVLACLGLLSPPWLSAAVKPKAGSSLKPKAQHSIQHQRSRVLRDLSRPDSSSRGPGRTVPTPHFSRPGGGRGTDAAIQSKPGATDAPTPLLSFAGSSAADDEVANLGAVSPANANGDVGAGQYVQVVNSIIQSWSTAGVQQLEPTATTALFEGLGEPCGGTDFNAVDTVIRYDELAGRWVLVFVPYDFGFAGDYHLCAAVSTSSDAGGSWNAYDFAAGDYLPTGLRLGVWPDAYYLTFDQLDGSFTDIGAVTVAFDRAAMIAGSEEISLLGLELPGIFGLVPADLDGAATPPEGTPNHQAAPGQADWDGSPDPVLHMFEFHVDFEDPESSSYDGPFDVAVPDFNPILCDGPGFNCIPELDGVPLNAQSGFLMEGMQYRNRGAYEALVVSHTVNVGDDVAATRWYEVRVASPTVREGVNPFSLFQSGTYAPTETNRFYPSIAMDVSGNIAMGYSVSDASIHPGIRVTGRLVGDPLGEMGDEASLIDGGGGQGNQFWGNITSMTVDPADGCTFFYTNQYLDSNGTFNWLTRIGTFKFGSCTSGPSGTLEGDVTDGTDPISGATVTAGANSTTTNAAGHYSFTLPVGTYDMTVTKYGFLPGSASGVEVTEENTTTQDFTLDVAPTALVNGTVRDAGGNWPLYAQIHITGPGYPGATLWTNPVSGYYSVTLVEGITYNFTITAFSQGYLPGGGQLPLGVPLGEAPALVQNWTLEADTVACNAPGYTFSTDGLYEQFTSGSLPPDWSIENHSEDGGPPWTIFSGSDPCGLFPGNETGGSGPYAVINSNCDGVLTTAVTDLITPSVNLSGIANPKIQFKSDFAIPNIDYPQTGTVDYSTNGGTSWTNLLTFDTNQPGPSTKEADLPAAADVKVRFHYDAFWAWWWQVDDVLMGVGNCEVGTGGLVVGNVYDAATNAGLDGATVTNLTGGGSTKTVATSDPAVDEGFYILYSDAGPANFEATKDQYSPAQGNTLVVPGSTVRLNFSLLSGNLSVTPTQLDGRTNPGGTDHKDITVTNTGAAEASFEFVEINAPLLPTETHGFAPEHLRRQAVARLPQGGKGPDHWARTAEGLAKLPGMPRGVERTLAAGDVISSFNTDLNYAWGVASPGTNIWITTFALGSGDFDDHEYTPDGTQTGNTIDVTGVGLWAGDGTFNPLTGMIWVVAVGGDNCLYELDPVSHSQTGNTICGSPWTGISQRGLAFDQATSTFYVGGWNELTVYHVDLDGNTIDSAFVNLPISGLAYAAASGHLLVMSNTDGPDITVLDALNNYDELGSFDVMDGGSDALGAFQQAGMDFDCIGNLWVTNQVTNVAYQVNSGESAGCAVDIPWFSVNPTEGTVGPAALRQGVGNTFPVSADWDSGSLLPGLRLAQLQVKTDTPHAVPPIPVTLTVRFLDVPDGNQFDDYIYAAAGAGVMFGGPPPCPQGILYFCPDGVVTRADMAGYLWRAINGRNTPPPVYQNIFTDVTFNDYNAFYIQGIYDLGITAGCGSGTTYCPDDPNTRQQMSVFIWKGEHGSEDPPACSGMFNDVPCPSQFADYIEALANEGVTAGCGGGNFCPTANITNGQMSVFLVKGFGIPVVILP